MTRAAKTEREIVSPWTLVAESRATVPAALAVSVGVALWVGAAPLFVGFGSLLASVGLLVLAVVAAVCIAVILVSLLELVLRPAPSRTASPVR